MAFKEYVGRGIPGGGFAAPALMDFDPNQMRGIREQIAGQANVANINQTPAKLQQSRFNTVFPWLKNQIGGLMGNFSSTVGGQSGQGPAINAGPVWSPEDIQQQTNQARARNDQAAQTDMRLAERSAGARGFGATSPMLAAIQNRIQMANQAENTRLGPQIRFGAAQANADQLLKSQQARESQFASRMGEDIERRRSVLGMFPSLFSAISGLV